ncbi:MAG: CcoQ/FixQ family Cbb3-type cytochrome c oxidase assembly chaperone [Alphaproteobacteria bacterium]|nr:CcoQ/FixQ family Cbb3-type cytochrome c oxidase assembly chaperone [Alphaproteobacteria bacterium]
MNWSDTIGALGDTIGAGWFIILGVLFMGVLYWAFRSNRRP